MISSEYDTVFSITAAALAVSSNGMRIDDCFENRID
jgi:hypothetical protein